MPANTIAYNVTFRDFQFLQGYMARRIFSRNRQKYWPALLGVVLCAFFLVLAMLLNVNPYRAVALFGTGIRYPLSFYLLVIVCLAAAIVYLIPAIKLRFFSLSGRTARGAWSCWPGAVPSHGSAALTSSLTNKLKSGCCWRGPSSRLAL